MLKDLTTTNKSLILITIDQTSGYQEKANILCYKRSNNNQQVLDTDNNKSLIKHQATKRKANILCYKRSNNNQQVLDTDNNKSLTRLKRKSKDLTTTIKSYTDNNKSLIKHQATKRKLIYYVTKILTTTNKSLILITKKMFIIENLGYNCSRDTL
ncbi:unnamed protein product [Mytilus coruscus]|uniref:Uncharacterized protein n=1 Tax=Mytilus coruscus TaxID=42192 RepID=A0A6J7ZVM9_MYTCO|nr:unnamed protein product [Mytilus coruscus]